MTKDYNYLNKNYKDWSSKKAKIGGPYINEWTDRPKYSRSQNCAQKTKRVINNEWVDAYPDKNYHEIGKESTAAEMYRVQEMGMPVLDPLKGFDKTKDQKKSCWNYVNNQSWKNLRIGDNIQYTEGPVTGNSRMARAGIGYDLLCYKTKWDPATKKDCCWGKKDNVCDCHPTWFFGSKACQNEPIMAEVLGEIRAWKKTKKFKHYKKKPEPPKNTKKAMETFNWHPKMPKAPHPHIPNAERDKRERLKLPLDLYIECKENDKGQISCNKTEFDDLPAEVRSRYTLQGTPVEISKTVHSTNPSDKPGEPLATSLGEPIYAAMLADRDSGAYKWYKSSDTRDDLKNIAVERYCNRYPKSYECQCYLAEGSDHYQKLKRMLLDTGLPEDSIDTLMRCPRQWLTGCNAPNVFKSPEMLNDLDSCHAGNLCIAIQNIDADLSAVVGNIVSLDCKSSSPQVDPKHPDDKKPGDGGHVDPHGNLDPDHPSRNDSGGKDEPASDKDLHIMQYIKKLTDKLGIFGIMIILGLIGVFLYVRRMNQ